MGTNTRFLTTSTTLHCTNNRRAMSTQDRLTSLARIEVVSAQGSFSSVTLIGMIRSPARPGVVEGGEDPGEPLADMPCFGLTGRNELYRLAHACKLRTPYHHMATIWPSISQRRHHRSVEKLRKPRFAVQTASGHSYGTIASFRPKLRAIKAHRRAMRGSKTEGSNEGTCGGTCGGSCLLCHTKAAR